MMNSIKNQIVRGRMKKLILLLCATLSSMAMPGNLSAAFFNQNVQQQLVGEQSFDSFTLLLTQFERNMRLSNKKVPSLTPMITDVQVLLAKLASILEIIKKPEAPLKDQIKILHRELLSILGDVSRKKKGLQVSVVREARTLVRDWAQRVAKKIVKSKARLLEAGINPDQALKILETLRIKLGQRIFNPSYAVYRGKVEEYFDRLVVKPFEWGTSNLSIVVPATLLIGFLVWTSQDSLGEMGNNIREWFDPINETRIPVLRQSGASCGYHGLKNALAFAELDPVVLTDRKDERLKAFEDPAPFNTFYDTARAELTTLHKPAIEKAQAELTVLNAEIALMTQHAPYIEAVRTELQRRIIAHYQNRVNEADRPRLTYIVHACLQSEDPWVFYEGLDMTQEQITALLRGVPQRLTDAQIESRIPLIRLASQLNIVEARYLLRTHSRNEPTNIFTSQMTTDRNTIRDIINACGADNLRLDYHFNMLWPEAERNNFWNSLEIVAAADRTEGVKVAVFDIIRERKQLNNMRTTAANAATRNRLLTTACGGNWISGTDAEHLIERMPGTHKEKIIVWEQAGGATGNLPATMDDFYIDRYWENGALNDLGHKIRKIVEFLDATPQDAHLVFVAGNGGHWIAVNCTKDAQGNIVAQMADSMGSSPGIRQMVLNVLRDPRVRQCWDRIQAARNPGHVASVVGGS